MDKQALDRYITGNYGEDSIDPQMESAVEQMFNYFEDNMWDDDFVDFTDEHTHMSEDDAYQLSLLRQRYGLAELLHTLNEGKK